MKRSIGKFAVLPFAVVFVLTFAGIAAAQGPQPFMQDIKVQRDAEPAPTPLIKKTGSSMPLGASPSAAVIKTSLPVLANVAIPGYSGVLVEGLNGETILESSPDTPFNPASNVKLATAFAVLKTFGPEYRFPTSIWTDGSYEEATATIHGNLYISGRDPIFNYEHAVSLANELNRMGIRTIKGDLVVTDNFAMSHSASPQRSSQLLFATLDSGKRSKAANTAWTNFLVNTGKLNQTPATPSVTFSGGVYVQPMPGNVNLLFSHESAKMRDILKVTLCYSNNFLSERLADMVGGPYAVTRLMQQHAGVTPYEFSIQTGSGLGINRVTPNAMMKVLRALRRDLAGYRMTFADIMPVAGIDKGTLENRFATDFSTGSVVGKTGTLGNTDGGASSLAGEINTRSGKLLFVIFNQRGSVSRFRSFQNSYVSLIQGQFGGAAALPYSEIPMNARLAKTRISYPDGKRSGGDDD